VRIIVNHKLAMKLRLAAGVDCDQLVGGICVIVNRVLGSDILGTLATGNDH